MAATAAKHPDLSEIAQFNRRPGGTCTVITVRPSMAEQDRTVFEAALASDLPAAAISRWAKSKGYRIGADSIARHRRGACACDA